MAVSTSTDGKEVHCPFHTPVHATPLQHTDVAGGKFGDQQDIEIHYTDADNPGRR